MQPSYHAIVKIFGPEIRHTVPLFQRPYVWTQEGQWEPLWDDISNLASRVLATPPEKTIAGHFLGTVVLEQTPSRSGSIVCREVIDGQQRLTTLQILLKATQHALAEIENTAAEQNDDVVEKAARIAGRQLSALTANPAYAEEEEKHPDAHHPYHSHGEDPVPGKPSQHRTHDDDHHHCRNRGNPTVLLAWRLPGLRPATPDLLDSALSYPSELRHPDAFHEDMVHSSVRVELNAEPAPQTGGSRACVNKDGVCVTANIRGRK